MDFWTPYLSAFLVGLLGGVHCVGMCGGIVSALTFSLAQTQQRSIIGMLPFQLAYNMGRTTSYLLAGAVMGALGMLLAQLMPIYYAQLVLLGLAGIFMILLGLYLGGWWMLLNKLEHLGAVLWRCLEPLGRRLLPVNSPYQAFTVGVIWGWIPCGLVYSMLVTAISTGGALQGAGLMLAFALGTMPNLLLIGMLAGAAARLAHSHAARRIAGGMVVLFGIHALWQAI